MALCEIDKQEILDAFDHNRNETFHGFICLRIEAENGSTANIPLSDREAVARFLDGEDIVSAELAHSAITKFKNPDAISGVLCASTGGQLRLDV